MKRLGYEHGTKGTRKNGFILSMDQLQDGVTLAKIVVASPMGTSIVASLATIRSS